MTILFWVNLRARKTYNKKSGLSIKYSIFFTNRDGAAPLIMPEGSFVFNITCCQLPVTDKSAGGGHCHL